jgi:hypothetical protein
MLAIDKARPVESVSRMLRRYTAQRRLVELRITGQNKTARTPKSEHNQNHVAEERTVNRSAREETRRPRETDGVGTRTNRLKADRKKKEKANQRGNQRPRHLSDA